MKIFPSSSALKHLRLPFSLFLLPVFLFALSQADEVVAENALLVFFIWHFLVYPASNGYNSYFDKDEESIALLKKPPAVDASLYTLSLILDGVAIVLAFFVSLEFLIAVIVYGTISKLYSHPAVRLKKYPFISFLVIFLFQGAFVYWTSYAAISGRSIFSQWNHHLLQAGLICSFLIGANYPLTQVYQHNEDRKRGDETLSIRLGVRGSFIFSAALFLTAVILSYYYWNNLDNRNNFYLFLLFSIPVCVLFFRWLYKVWHDEKEASYKNMSAMTWTAALMMLIFFATVWLIKMF